MKNETLTFGDTPTAGAVKWLLEMESVMDPNVINVLILNIYKVSDRIKDVEIVFDDKRKAILIFLELSKWGQWFHAKNIQDWVEEVITQALPSYRMRVIYDREILGKALEILEKRG